MLIDSHAHLHNKKFNKDREQIIKSLYQEGVELVINSGGGPESNIKALDLAKRYANIYATVGINCGGEDEWNEIPTIIPLLNHKKVVAIGEIGLDYHHYPNEKEIQKNVLWNKLRSLKKWIYQ